MADYKAIEQIARESSRFNDVLILQGGGTVSLLERFGLLINRGYPQVGLSRSLDGKLHYSKRQITVQATCLRPKDQLDVLQKELEALLQGQWVWFRFKKDAYFWRGFCTVSMQRKEHSALVTLTAVCNPYNYNLTAYMGSAWLWDTFNFEKDTIYDVRTEVKNL